MLKDTGIHKLGGSEWDEIVMSKVICEVMQEIQTRVIESLNRLKLRYRCLDRGSIACGRKSRAVPFYL